MSHDKSHDSTVSIRPLLGWALGVFVVWALGGLAAWQTADPGKTGDIFGAINALFSGLAFAGIIYTILLQRKELALQREELAATRDELARTARAQEKSEQALQEQVQAAKTSHRIDALNNMLKFSVECYSRIRTEPLNDRERPGVERWANRRMELTEEMEKVYSELFAPATTIINKE